MRKKCCPLDNIIADMDWKNNLYAWKFGIIFLTKIFLSVVLQVKASEREQWSFWGQNYCNGENGQMRYER